MTTPSTVAPASPASLSSRDRLLLLFLALDAIGGGYISYKLYTDSVLMKGTGKSSGSCSQTFGSSCDAALSHAASVFMGIAWPVWSAAFYFMIFGLLLTVSSALWRRLPMPPTEGAPWARFLTLSFLGACVISIYLGYINYTQLSSPCPMCTGLYIVNAVGLGLSLSLRPGKPAQLLQGIPGILKSSQTQGALLTFILAVVFFQFSYNDAVQSGVQLSKAQSERAAQELKSLYGTHTFDLSKAPRKGAANAKIQLVEFSDFECPFCARFAQELKTLQASFPDDLSIHFFQYPLSFHPSARIFAAVSICADQKGKFWETHDALFALATKRAQEKLNKTAVTDAELVSLANDIGLDPEVLLSCVRSPETDARIDADIAQASKVVFENPEQTLGLDPKQVAQLPNPNRVEGLIGTPTWFMNGYFFSPKQIQPSAVMMEPLVKRLLSLPDAAPAPAPAAPTP
jgi:protein-disulfide isomerase/uncharacterized membrane protein